MCKARDYSTVLVVKQASPERPFDGGLLDLKRPAPVKTSKTESGEIRASSQPNNTVDTSHAPTYWLA